MKYNFKMGWTGQLTTKHKKWILAAGAKYVQVIGISLKNETEKQEENWLLLPTKHYVQSPCCIAVSKKLRAIPVFND